MSWFTENPWPLILLLSGATVVMLILGGSKGRSVAIVLALLAIAVYFLESSIVTSGEQIEGSLQNLLKGFIAEDLAAIDQQIDDDAPGLKEKAKQGLQLVNLDKTFHMQDIVVMVEENGQKAIAELRANGSLTVEKANMPYHAATRWRTHWKRVGDRWKLAEVHRLNSVTGEEIGVLDAQ